MNLKSNAAMAIQGDAAAPIVAQGPSPVVLRSALLPKIGLALWHRPARASLNRPVAAVLDLPPFGHVVEDTPENAVRELVRRLPFAGLALAGDVGQLARVFADMTGEVSVRLRLEHVADDACRCHHVDAVHLRLLCTYAGPGTEWLDEAGQTRQMPAMQVGVFKGSAFPDDAPRVRHRSPPVSHLPVRQRSRLLLCIDQPGMF